MLGFRLYGSYTSHNETTLPIPQNELEFPACPFADRFGWRVESSEVRKYRLARPCQLRTGLIPPSSP